MPRAWEEKTCEDCGNPCAGNGKKHPACRYWRTMPDKAQQEAMEEAVAVLDSVIRLESAQYRLECDAPESPTEWGKIIKAATLAIRSLKRAKRKDTP